MKRWLSAVALGGTLAFGSTGRVAAQTTLDFESVPAGAFVTQYGGFTFSGGQGSSSWVNSNLAAHGTHSGTRHVWSNGGTWLDFSRASLFNFSSVWLAGVNGGCSGPSVMQTVRGYRTGIELYSSTVALSCTATNLYDFGFVEVDRVVFDQASPAVNLMVDDITYSEVGAEGTVTPEPVSMVLLGSGLAGLGAVRRRRRRTPEPAA